MSFAAGMRIGPNLQLVRPLAKGGMGSLWIADHLALQTQVAVKFISESTMPELAVVRFEQEAAAMARLKSPHIVHVFDFGLAPGGIPYISMDLLEGESLGARLRAKKRLTAVETAAIVLQTCRALSRAHELHVVHRDIKPDNIFITDSGGELFIKLLDFGIAKTTGDGSLSMTHSGMTMGTPFYMSPEQILSARTVTGNADLWALSAVAYECLTGQTPFNAESYGGLCLAISGGRFEPPTRVLPELVSSLDMWFARAFRLHEKERFANAAELSATFLVAAQVSRTAAMSVASGLEQRPPSGTHRPAGAVDTPVNRAAMTIALDQRAGAGPRPDGQVATQRSSLGEPESADDEAFQISRPSLSGASLSSPAPPPEPREAPKSRARGKLWAAAGLVIAAALGILFTRESTGPDARNGKLASEVDATAQTAPAAVHSVPTLPGVPDPPATASEPPTASSTAIQPPSPARVAAAAGRPLERPASHDTAPTASARPNPTHKAVPATATGADVTTTPPVLNNSAPHADHGF